jgi:hypothetical protein
VVAAVEQMTPAGAQLVGEMEAGHALAELAKDHYEPTGAVSNALQRRASVEIEDAPAFATTVVHDGRTVAIVRGLIGRQRASVWAMKPFGMEGFQQHSVAPLLVEQVLDEKEHHAHNRSTSIAVSSAALRTPAGSSVGPLHPDGPMSQTLCNVAVSVAADAIGEERASDTPPLGRRAVRRRGADQRDQPLGSAHGGPAWWRPPRHLPASPHRLPRGR